MKQTIIDKMVVILDIYKDPEELHPIMNQPDFEGRDTFWYF